MGKNVWGTKRSDGRLTKTFTYKGHRYYVYGYSKQDLEARVQEKIRELENSSYKKNKNITLNEYFKEYVEVKRGSVKASTLNNVISKMKKNLKVLGDYKVCEIEKRQVLDLQHKLLVNNNGTKLAIVSVNAAISLLKSVMQAAVEDEIIEKNPCDNIKMLRDDKKIPARETKHRALTEEETRLFLEAASAANSFQINLFKFLFNCGCRIGEASVLVWNDIDYNKNVIHINKTKTRTPEGKAGIGSPKTKTSKRDIPLTPALKKILNDQKELQGRVLGFQTLEGNARIFQTIRGNVLEVGKVNCDIMKYCKKAGIEYFSVHATRDTFATRAIEQGMKPNTLKEILGHSTLAMTMDLYAHVMDDTKQKEMNALTIAI